MKQIPKGAQTFAQTISVVKTGFEGIGYILVTILSSFHCNNIKSRNGENVVAAASC